MTTYFDLSTYDTIVAKDLSLNGSISSALGGLSQWDNSGSDIYFSSGNVGIGTASPTTKLHILGDGPAMFASSTSIHSSLLNTAGAKIIINNRTLKEDSPSTDETKSHGKIIWTGHDRSLPSAYIESASDGWDDAGDLRFAVSAGGLGASEKMRIDTNGNVGIGTTSPTAQLHIHENSTSKNTHLKLSHSTTGTGNASDGFDLVLERTSNDMYLIQREDADLFFRTKNTNRMIINNNGNVGIGTTSPAQQLHATGRVQAGEMVLGDLPRSGGSWAGLYNTRIYDDTNNVGYNNNAYILGAGENGNLLLNCTSAGSGLSAIAFQANGSTKMTLNSNGTVGIGIETPYAKLHVNGTYSAGNINMTTRNWIKFNTQHVQVYRNYDTSSLSASIYASGDIVTNSHLISSSIYATSDRRIKQNIVDINDNSALETLRLLKPKKYEYIDKFSKTQSTVWGFIAQEVAETLPYATYTGKNEIPNIYQVANVSNDNLLTFSTNIQLEYDASGSVVNDLLLYDASDNRIDVTIQEIVSTTELRIESETVLSNEVFVYGQRVNDFHYLDKPAVFTVGISAIQEVDRQQQADKAKIATLESENATLKTQVADILQRLSNANL